MCIQTNSSNTTARMKWAEQVPVLLRYDAITMEQFVNIIEVLKLSKHLKPSINQRGKTNMTHGKGKRKHK